MLTKVRGLSDEGIQVLSQDEDVQVAVKRRGKNDGAPLDRVEVHDALVRAKKKAEHFVAAVEGDIEAVEG